MVVRLKTAQHHTGERETRVDRLSNAAPLSEVVFLNALCLERRRAERARRRFILTLLDLRGLPKAAGSIPAWEAAAAALREAVRDTDVIGWYKGSTLGVLFTELGAADTSLAVHAISKKVRDTLESSLGAAADGVPVCLHVFPEDAASIGSNGRVDFSLYPDVVDSMRSRKQDRILKRTMDIAGSLLALIISSPLLFAIAVLIKLTSPGPVLFRQTRLGQYGKRISFLKFRSMYSMNNDEIHQEYMKRYISGGASCAQGCVYKITDDPRVTPFGRLLRRTSLDEFPQFLNVLLGDMSLVGPRPPIPYEFDAYDEWHKRRLLVKPGITGLWQVRGRSLTTFDEMVRMDLDYAASWSPWGDLKLLLQTPRAVLSGKGAF